MHKNKDFGFLIYIYNIYSVTQNGSSPLPPKYSSAGQLLLCTPRILAAQPASFPSLSPTHLFFISKSGQY
jgi:hypothetical protein